MKFILAAGVTGGHLYPAIAVAKKLETLEQQVTIYCTSRALDTKVLADSNLTHRQLSVRPFMGSGLIGKLYSLASVAIAVIKVLPSLRRDDIVVLFGGYVSVAVGIAAILRGSVIYIHEQNSLMGRSNRLFAKRSRAVFVTYDDCKNCPTQSNIIVSGNPLRDTVTTKEPKDTCGKNLLVIGGSQGSRYINNIIANSSKLLLERGYTIVHQTGTALYEEVLNIYRNNYGDIPNRVQLLPYIDDVDTEYLSADILIARSGSGTVFETLRSRRAALYIPLKTAADDHQYHNALAAESMGVAKLVREEDLTTELLLEKLDEIQSSYDSIKKSFESYDEKDSVEIIVKELLSGTVNEQ